MAKITPMDKAVSIDKFRKLFMKGILDWEEDERRDMPPKERRRTWWNKDDIMRICNWPGSWSKLRKLLETRIGLIMLRYGAPRKDLCWTFATSKNDRERTALNALSIQVGIAKYAADTLQKQLAPVDRKYALTEESRDNMDAVLIAKHGTALDKVIKSIAEVRGGMWLDDMLALTARPAATEEAHDE